MKVNTVILLPLLLMLTAVCHAQYVEHEWEVRDRWMDVGQILEWAGVDHGDTVADIGCHEGYLSMHLARKVGESGRVFAVDVREDRVQSLKRNALERNFNHVVGIVGKPANPMLPQAAVDVVFLMDTYHEIAAYREMLEHLRNSLKPGGRIVVLEKLKAYAREKSREEQASAHTLSPEYVREELIHAGFDIIQEFDDLGHWENEPDKTIWLLIGRVARL